jgi:Dirigent-like protein
VSRFPKVAAAGVAATVLAVVLAPAGSAQQPGERTLTFTERGNRGTFRIIDNPPRNPKGVSERRFRFSAGDAFVFSSPLFDAANRRRVGRLAGLCTVFRGGTFETSALYCTVGIKLSNGSIEFQGSVRFSGVVRIAVVGGTRAYEGARGSFTSTEGKRTSTDVVHLLP